MKITNKPDQVIVEHKGLTFVFNFNTLYKDMLKSDILKYISLQELRQLFLIGIPNNIKEFLQKKIEFYDSSSEVNSFIYKGNNYWLDKATRVGLMHLANCSTDNIQLVLEDQILTIPIDIVKNFLQQLEVYAGQCYLQTQKHLIAIKDLKTIEDIINYDYTKGYPDKLNLDEYIDLA